LNNKENNRKKINNEKNIVKMMIVYYCKNNHLQEENLCCDCEKLIGYAWLKLDKCPYGENKPACSKCKIHCYNALMRKKIKDIMRFSGPRMIFIYPSSVLRHLAGKMNFKKDYQSKI